MFFKILGTISTSIGAPVKMDIHTVFRKRFRTIFTIITVMVTLFIEHVFLKNIKPYIHPARKDVIVKPGKKKLFGAIIMPNISAKAAASPPITGPNIMLHVAIGTKPNPIRMVLVSIDKKRVNTTFIAINMPTTATTRGFFTVNYHLLLLNIYLINYNAQI